MRTQFVDYLERGRVSDGSGYSTKPGDQWGMFRLNRIGVLVTIVASGGKLAQEPTSQGWEHVSVSTTHRTPTWDEMCWAKDLFWEPAEVVLQLHPPADQWVDNHPYCLHLWKPPYPVVLPPSTMVGKQGMSYAEARALGQAIGGRRG